MTTAHPTIGDLAAAVAELDQLDQLDDLDRAVAARHLARSLPQALADVADAAVYAATRESTQPAVAARLGVSTSQVERAITRHRARLGPGGGKL